MTSPQDPFAAPGDQPPEQGQQPPSFSKPAEHGTPPPGYGPPQGYPPPQAYPPPYPPPYGQAPYTAQRTNTLAIVGFILTLVVCPPVGAVVCFIALSQIKQTGEGGRGLALAGIWICVVAVVLAVLAVLALFTFGAAVEGNFESTVVPVPSPR